MEQAREPMFYSNEQQNFFACGKENNTLQSIDSTLKRIERMLVSKVSNFEPKIETSSEDSLSGQCNFTESDFSFSENPDPIVAEKLLWAFEKDEKKEDIIIVPMNGDRIVIHGRKEAEMFCNVLIGYFQ